MSTGTTPGPPSGAADPLAQLRQLLPRLNDASHRAAAHILHAPAEAARSSITDLAQACDVSPATLTRLAGQLGFSGFPQLRAAIATEHGREVQGGWTKDIGTEITTDDPPERVLDVLVAHETRALRAAQGGIDLALAAVVADALAGAHRIHLYGEWGDAVPLAELAMRLLRIGRPVWHHDSPATARVIAAGLGPLDVVLVMSRAGDDPAGEGLLQRARAHGAIGVLVTGAPDGTLAAAAHHVLRTGTPAGTTWTDHFAGRVSDTLVTSLLWVLVAQRVPQLDGWPFPQDDDGPLAQEEDR